MARSCLPRIAQHTLIWIVHALAIQRPETNPTSRKHKMHACPRISPQSPFARDHRCRSVPISKISHDPATPDQPVADWDAAPMPSSASPPPGDRGVPHGRRRPREDPHASDALLALVHVAVQVTTDGRSWAGKSSRPLMTNGRRRGGRAVGRLPELLLTASMGSSCRRLPLPPPRDAAGGLVPGLPLPATIPSWCLPATFSTYYLRL
jgi:hypothetical protein